MSVKANTKKNSQLLYDTLSLVCDKYGAEQVFDILDILPYKKCKKCGCVFTHDSFYLTNKANPAPSCKACVIKYEAKNKKRKANR